MKFHVSELVSDEFSAGSGSEAEFEDKTVLREILYLWAVFVGLVTVFTFVMLLPAMASPLPVIPKDRIVSHAANKSGLHAEKAGPVAPRASAQRQKISVAVGRAGRGGRLVLQNAREMRTTMLDQGAGRYIIRFDGTFDMDLASVRKLAPASLRHIRLRETANGTDLELQLEGGKALARFPEGGNLVIEIRDPNRAGVISTHVSDIDLATLPADQFGDQDYALSDHDNEQRTAAVFSAR